jgi:hypothetical protein
MRWFESRQGNGVCVLQYMAVFLNSRIYKKEAPAQTDMSEVYGILECHVIFLVYTCNSFRAVSIHL